MSNFYNLKLIAKHWQNEPEIIFPNELSWFGRPSAQGIAKVGRELEELLKKIEDIEELLNNKNQ